MVDNDATPPPYPSPLINYARRERHFANGILESAESGAELVQAGDWSAVALWESPSYQGKPFIESKARPGAMLNEWRSRVRAAKAKYLAAPAFRSSSDSQSSTNDSISQQSCRDAERSDESQLRPYYHLSFLARNPSAPRVEGSINAVMTPFLDRAREEMVPAWLEATTPQAVRVYERHGFRIVEEIVLGKGKIDAQGWPTSDGTGEGVTAWAMIFDSHLRD